MKLTRTEQRIVAALEAGHFCHLAHRLQQSVFVLPQGGRPVLFVTTLKTIHSMIDKGILDRQWRLTKEEA